MKITKNQIKALKPCSPAWDWYLTKSSKSKDLETLLLETNDKNPSWARWLFTHLMTQKQCVEIAIFAAEKVLPIFEAEHPEDDRPRKAIEAAKAWLQDPSEENRKAATDAAYAAAAYATDAAYAAYAAAAYAAYAAAYATYAVADAAGATEKNKLQISIIKEAVRILDRDASNG